MTPPATPTAGGNGDTWQIIPVDVRQTRYYEGMTFPAYRPLLKSPPSDRLALGLTDGGTPAGLGLAEFGENGEVIVRSLYVIGKYRGRGYATALLAALEDAARAAGKVKLSAVWMAGQGFTETVEHILAKGGWAPPELRMYVLKSDLESIDRSRWLTRAKLEPGFETFLWTELTAAEREAMMERQRMQPIPDYVWPFASSPDVEPKSSLGVRYRGEVVGWVVNHPFDANTVRFTCSYMRDELQGRGRLVAAYAESIDRCRAAGISEAIWTVPVQFPRMVAFARRHLMPYATSLTETRGSFKRLVAVG
jgi:GNAT superfamily N-acetyltransferase